MAPRTPFRRSRASANAASFTLASPSSSPSQSSRSPQGPRAGNQLPQIVISDDALPATPPSQVSYQQPSVTARALSSPRSSSMPSSDMPGNAGSAVGGESMGTEAGTSFRHGKGIVDQPVNGPVYRPDLTSMSSLMSNAPGGATNQLMGTRGVAATGRIMGAERLQPIVDPTTTTATTSTTTAATDSSAAPATPTGSIPTTTTSALPQTSNRSPSQPSSSTPTTSTRLTGTAQNRASLPHSLNHSSTKTSISPSSSSSSSPPPPPKNRQYHSPASSHSASLQPQDTQQRQLPDNPIRPIRKAATVADVEDIDPARTTATSFNTRRAFSHRSPIHPRAVGLSTVPEQTIEEGTEGESEITRTSSWAKRHLGFLRRRPSMSQTPTVNENHNGASVGFSPPPAETSSGQQSAGVLSSLLTLAAIQNAPTPPELESRAATPACTPMGSPPRSGASTPRPSSIPHASQLHHQQLSLPINSSRPSLLGGSSSSPDLVSLISDKLRYEQNKQKLRKYKQTLFRKNKAEREDKVKAHIAQTLTRQQFIVRLCWALMRYGAPPHRMEEYLESTAAALSISGHFLYTPACTIISFEDTATHTTEVKLVRAPAGVDLGRMYEVHDIYKDVTHGRISVDEAMLELRSITDRKVKYPKWATVLAHGLAAASVGPFGFQARLIDVPMGFLLGIVLGTLQLYVAEWDQLYSNLFEIGAAFVTSFLARAIGSIQGGNLFCFSALAQSSIALILPGYIVLCACLELTSHKILAGSVRMVYAVLYTIFLGYGIMIGSTLYGLIDSNASSAVGCQQPLHYKYNVIFVALFSLALCMVNQAKWRHTPVMIFIAVSAYCVTFFSSRFYFGTSPLSNMCGSLALGVLANLYSRLGPRLERTFDRTWDFTSRYLASKLSSWKSKQGGDVESFEGKTLPDHFASELRSRGGDSGFTTAVGTPATGTPAASVSGFGEKGLSSPKSAPNQQPFPSHVEPSDVPEYPFPIFDGNSRPSTPPFTFPAESKDGPDGGEGPPEPRRPSVHRTSSTTSTDRRNKSAYSLAAAAMLPALWVQVPSGLAVSGSLLTGIISADDVLGHREKRDLSVESSSPLSGLAGLERALLVPEPVPEADVETLAGTKTKAAPASAVEEPAWIEIEARSTPAPASTSQVTMNVNASALNIMYSVVQVGVAMTVGLSVGAIIVYPFGKKRNSVFAF